MIASQKPRPGTPVSKGTKVSFTVVKKTDIVTGNIAAGACTTQARGVGATPEGAAAVIGSIPATPTKLGVIVRIPLVNDTTTDIAGYLRCEYSEAKKNHTLVTFEV